MSAFALGLDLGGTKILAGLVDETGIVHHEWRLATPVEGGGEAIMQGLIDAVATIRGQLSASQAAGLVGIGVSTAGHVDHVQGKVLYCTGNVPGWSGMPVAERLEAACGLGVTVDNDANCAAYGEYWAGAGRGVANLLAITLGTGLGGGIVADGHVIRGARGGGAELGHLILVPDGRSCNCGQNGCWESYASGTAIARSARELGTWGPEVTSHEVFAKARAGDAAALGVIHQMADHLAIGIVSMINILDPQRIVIGGGVSNQADLYLPRVREQVTARYGERGWDVQEIRVAALGERAGMIGAAGEALARSGTRVAVAS